MLDNTIKYLINPITSSLLFDLEEMGEATAKQLAVNHPEIPHATLYRSLNRMCKDKIIEIVRENKIRGTFEKVYRLSSGFSTNINEALFDEEGNPVANFKEEYLKYFMQFAKGLIKEFQTFVSTQDTEPSDCGGFTIHSVYATNSEMQKLLEQINEQVLELQKNEREEGRTLRNIAVIIPPVQK